MGVEEILYWLVIVILSSLGLRYLLLRRKIRYASKISKAKMIMLAILAILLFSLVSLMHYAPSVILFSVCAWFYAFTATICQGIAKDTMWIHQNIVLTPFSVPFSELDFVRETEGAIFSIGRNGEDVPVWQEYRKKDEHAVFALFKENGISIL